MKEGQQERKEEYRSPIPDLFTMTPEQELHFKQSVEQSQGEALVYIHPYYNLFNTSETVSSKDLEGVAYVNEATTNSLQNADSQPVIIFEEYTNIGKLQNFIENKTVKAQVSKVDTELDDVIPRFGDYNPREGLSPKELIARDWQKLVVRLKELGVKKVKVGGQFLWADSRGGNKGGTGTGCVGSAITRFSRSGFHVELGETSPDSRQTIQDLKIEEFKKYL